MLKHEKDSLKNQIEVLKCNNGVLRERLNIDRVHSEKRIKFKGN